MVMGNCPGQFMVIETKKDRLAERGLMCFVQRGSIIRPIMPAHARSCVTMSQRGWTKRPSVVAAAGPVILPVANVYCSNAEQ
jgi:hypothetical protein